MRVGTVARYAKIGLKNQEAFQRYMSRADLDALRANLQAKQAKAEKPADGDEQPGAGDAPDHGAAAA